MTPLTRLARKTRDELLATLDGVVKELREVRATSPEADPAAFQLAESTLLGCRGAVDGARDVEPLIHTLKQAAAALKTGAGGALAPPVQRVRTTLANLWTVLELQV